MKVDTGQRQEVGSQHQSMEAAASADQVGAHRELAGAAEAGSRGTAGHITSSDLTCVIWEATEAHQTNLSQHNDQCVCVLQHRLWCLNGLL